MKNRALIVLITIFVAAVGGYSMTQLKQELIPSLELPMVSVVTISAGGAPEVMDELVSEPISQQLKAVDGVEGITSTSSSSMSNILVESEYGYDSNKLRLDIEAVINDLEDSMPAGSQTMVMVGSTADIPVMALTASTSGELSIQDLSARLYTIAVPALEDVSGVRQATVTGGLVDRVSIEVDQVALAATGLDQTAISDALDNYGVTFPLGNLTEDGVDLPAQAGQTLETLDDLRSLPLVGAEPLGQVTTLGDVASIEIVTEDSTSITRMNGQDAIALSVTALPDADLVQVSADIEAILGDLESDLGEGVTLSVVFDQAPFIQESISDLAVEGMLGLVFAVLVILLFLFSFRSTLVTAVSIPLSVLATFIGLWVGGYSLNMLTLGALAISIGRVVDDSIVVIENIKRHLSYGKPKKQAVLTGVREVAAAITASTLTSVMVFLPIALVSGMVGELFRPFALTVAIAMGSSLIVAITIVPVLAYWFLERPARNVDPAEVRAAAEEKEKRAVLQRAYLPIIRGTQKRPVLTLLSAVVILGITLGMTPFLKFDFLGDTGQNSVSVIQKFDSGTDIEVISADVEATEQAIRDVDGVQNVLMTAGQSGDALALMFAAGGANATFQIITDPDGDQAKILDDITAAVEDLELAETIEVQDAAASLMGSSTVDVIVTAFDDEEALADAADEVEQALKDAAYVTEHASDRTADQPTLQLTVDREAAAVLGLNELQVAGMVAGALTETSIGDIRIDSRDFEIYIDQGERITTAEELRELPVPTAMGMQPLSEIAEITQVNVPTQITRMEGDLIATISLTPEEGQLRALTTEINDRLDELDLPPGVHVEIGGVSAEQQEAFSQLGIAMVIAILIVYILMVATFNSLIQPFILLISIPFAATGAIFALLLTGKPLAVASLIGMLMLIGIVVTNAIVLIDLINQYRQRGQELVEAVINGARQRLRPILMTALAAVGAMLPMALGVTGSTGFISQDLAVVVIGGLVSSTALTLILVPVLYQLVEARKERRALASEARADARAEANDQAGVSHGNPHGTATPDGGAQHEAYPDTGELRRNRRELRE